MGTTLPTNLPTPPQAPRYKGKGVCFCAALTSFWWRGSVGEGWACSHAHGVLKYGPDVEMLAFDPMEQKASQDRGVVGF